MLIDSHCHLNMPELAGRLSDILAHMSQADIGQAIAISVDRDSSAEVLKLAEQHPNLYASVGIHPENPDTAEMSVDELIEASQHPKVVGIGETGLDYHWCSGDLAWQHARFTTHILASNHTGLPLIIHTRDAGHDTLRLLRENHAQQGVIHCFTEDKAFAKAVLDLGFYISFSGIVTFKNAQQIQEACKYVPLDRLLVETDAPYLAPVPKRGKQNEPAYVRYTAEFVAQLRGDSMATIEEATTANTYRLFSKLPVLISQS